MRLLEWFLDLCAGPPRAALPKSQPRVKFLEGTEWTCPCGTTIAIARRDIHYDGIKKSSDWDIKDNGFWDHNHCGMRAVRILPGGVRQFHTPTGWVG